MIDRADKVDVGELLFEEVDDAIIVVGGHQNYGITALSVTACTTRLLVVRFERVAHCVMDYKSHISFVDSHSEGVGSHHNTGLTAHPLILSQSSLGIWQTTVVERCRIALLDEEICHSLGGISHTDIDDSATRYIVDYSQQLPLLVVGLSHAIRKVWAEERGLQNIRLGKCQLLHNILCHLWRC